MAGQKRNRSEDGDPASPVKTPPGFADLYRVVRPISWHPDRCHMAKIWLIERRDPASAPPEGITLILKSQRTDAGPNAQEFRNEIEISTILTSHILDRGISPCFVRVYSSFMAGKVHVMDPPSTIVKNGAAKALRLGRCYRYIIMEKLQRSFRSTIGLFLGTTTKDPGENQFPHADGRIHVIGFITSCLAQFLHALECTQEDLGLVHYDAHIDNFMTTPVSSPSAGERSWRFSRPSKAGDQPDLIIPPAHHYGQVMKIIDLGLSRLIVPGRGIGGGRRKRVLSASGYEDKGITGDFHPHWDTRRWASSFVATVGDRLATILQTLPEALPLIDVLHAMLGVQVGQPLPGFPQGKTNIMDILATTKPGTDRSVLFDSMVFTQKLGDPSISVTSILNMPAFDVYRTPGSPESIPMGIYPK